MKRLVLSAIVLAAAWQTYGQGTVFFQNSGGSATTNVPPTGSAPRTNPTNEFVAGLYFINDAGSNAPTMDDPRWMKVGDGGYTGNGIYNGGIVTAPTTLAGGFGWFQVRAWEKAFGTTYEAVLAAGPRDVPWDGGKNRQGYAGTSNFMRIDTGDPTASPPGTPGTLVGNVKTFNLVIVPEPTTIALGLLGVGALLMLRRRK